MKEVLRPSTLGKLPIRSTAEPSLMSAVIYGHSGVGKTVLIGSAAEVEEMSPVLIIDTEQGTMSLTGRYNSDNIDVVTVTSYQDYADIHNAIRTGAARYKTVIIDSISEMAMLGLEEIVSRQAAIAKSKGKEHDPEQPDQGDWYKNSLRVHKVIRFFRGLPCHTFFVALEYLDVSRPTKPMFQPSLNTKRLSGELPGAVDEVWYMYKKEDVTTKEVNRFILTDASDKAMAKDRSQRLPLTMKNPDMQTIFDYYTGKKDKNNG